MAQFMQEAFSAHIICMHQHWVPASYLRAWCGPTSKDLQNPYVWRFSKDGSEIRRESPQNLFRESNMYTFTDEKKQPNLAIEKALSRLEDHVERLRRDKILPYETLTDEDNATLFLFVATAHFRTQVSLERWRQQWARVVEMGDRMAKHTESASPEDKAPLENYNAYRNRSG
jgi:hypothetical protein